MAYPQKQRSNHGFLDGDASSGLLFINVFGGNDNLLYIAEPQLVSASTWLHLPSAIAGGQRHVAVCGQGQRCSSPTSNSPSRPQPERA